MATSNLWVKKPQYDFKRESKGLMFWMSEIIQNKYYYTMEGEVDMPKLSA